MCILWLIFKILKGICSFLFGSSSNKETSSQTVGAIDNDSNKKTFSQTVGAIDSNSNKKTSSQIVRNDKPSYLKYSDKVYISFRDKVQKAYEAYKATGEIVSWEPENDGFSFFMETQDSMEGETFSAFVMCNNNNKLSSIGPYYLSITYSFSIKKGGFGYYENLANFLNNYYRTHNMLSKELLIAHGIFTVEYSDIGMYTCQIFLTDISYLCHQTEAFGERYAFDRLFKMAKEKVTEGKKLYNAEMLRDANVFTN